ERGDDVVRQQVVGAGDAQLRAVSLQVDLRLVGAHRTTVRSRGFEAAGGESGGSAARSGDDGTPCAPWASLGTSSCGPCRSWAAASGESPSPRLALVADAVSSCGGSCLFAPSGSVGVSSLRAAGHG